MYNTGYDIIYTYAYSRAHKRCGVSHHLVTYVHMYMYIWYFHNKG